MTKLRIMSDLHLEFGALDLQPIGEDVLVLAGDIGIYADGAFWARDYARERGVPVVMIAGNHEFYRNIEHQTHTVQDTLETLRAVAAKEPLMTFLEDDVSKVAGVVFIGCTLWTDFDLDGDQPFAMIRAAEAMNDYRLINESDRLRFTPDLALRRHAYSVGVLRERLPHKYPEGPVVVVTHHLPSRRSIAGRYADDDLNAAYASGLDGLVESSGAALWVHGHTHVSQDYRIGETRVLCNPRGYDGFELNPEFDLGLIIEVGP